MSDVTFEEVLDMAHQLTPEDKARLAQQLQLELASGSREALTLDGIIVEHQRRLAAGAFNNVESSHGKYAKPGLSLSAEELDRGLSEIANQWEEDLDEFSPHA